MSLIAYLTVAVAAIFGLYLWLIADAEDAPVVEDLWLPEWDAELDELLRGGAR
jgi:hypothetical protein